MNKEKEDYFQSILKDMGKELEEIKKEMKLIHQKIESWEKEPREWTEEDVKED